MLKRSLTMRRKTKTMQKYLTELSNDRVSNYSLWETTKSSNRPQVQIPPLKIDNANWAKSNKQKVDTFAKHLRETFSCHDSCIDIPNDLVEHLYDEPIAVYSDTEVKLFINQLKLRKSPGFDLITAEILLEMSNNILMALTNLLNCCLS